MEKYSLETQKIISSCEGLAYSFGHSLVGSEHLLLALLKDNNLLSKELKTYKVNYDNLYKKIKNIYPSHNDEPLYMEYTLELKSVLENALVVSRQYREEKISVNDLCIALTLYENSMAYDLLKKLKVDIYGVSQNIQNKMIKKSELDTLTDLHSLASVKHDPLIGRDDEINQLINALSRRNKPNAILVGEPGVGKTAIVEELAYRLQNNEIPSLKNKMIYELDLASTVGGTKYRGEFEEKVKKILKKVIEDGNAILFIDEIHNIIKAGGAEGAIDASNILKPYLSRNQIQLIGATTEDEFQQIFEKDKALKRRFQVIKVLPSSIEETRQILYKIKNIYENFYSLKIDNEVLDYIVELTSRCLPNYYFPDKAIDTLDNACVISKNKLTKEDVNITIERYYKISVNSFNKANLVKENILKRISGQIKPIEKIINNLSLLDNNIYDKDKPLLSMLFVGPSGVGKTEISKIIGEIYFTNENIIYLDMSSYQEISSLSKLIGFNGQDNNPKLVRELKAHPKSLIILDEIEKANNEVLDFFLQIMDQGFFDSTKGEKIDCRNSMIIMTSNYGFDNSLNFKKNITFSFNEEYILTKLQNRFRFEFLSRLDDIIVFDFLTKDIQKCIARNYLHSLDANFEISSLDDILIHSQEEYEKYGARLIKKDCKKAILNKIEQKN